MDNQESPQTPAPEPCCGPGCGCNTKPAVSNSKKLFLAIVIVAVAGILIYKLAFQTQAVTAVEPAGFNTTEITNTPQAKSTPASSTVEILASMNALNEKAMDKDAVLVWVSALSGGPIPDAVLSAIRSAQQTIQSKGVSLGLYQLQPGSADQTNMSSQMTLPAALLLSKGKGMSVVTGDITTEKLIQAFVASNRAGGCCPSGAGSPSCPPAAAPQGN
ncbi:MAG: hypothetical protein V1913_10360 [Fibrobacterota bacterium]